MIVGSHTDLRAQAEAAIARPRATAEALEELRVRHLGRKAELPQLLRGVPSCRRPNGARSARRPTRRAGAGGADRDRAARAERG